MNGTRTGPVVRGLAAVGVLAASLAGVPMALLALGQGPPGGIASGSDVAHALTHRVSDSTLLRTAGLLCWLVWGLFALAVVIEVGWQLAALSGRLPTATRRLGIPGLQGWARTLVVTAALLLPQRGLATAGAAPALPVPVQTTTAPAGPPGPPVGRSSAVVVPAAIRRPPAGERRYVVQRYDSLWSIAERHLGSGTRWREIRDHAGRVLAAEGTGARMIHPGEVLLLPGEGPPRQVTAPAPPKHRVTTNRAPQRVAPPVGATTPPLAATPPASRVTPPAAATPPAPPVSAPPTAPSPTGSPPMAASSAELAPALARLPDLPPPGPASTTASPPPTMMAVAADRGSSNGGPNVGALLEAGLVGAATMGIIRARRRRQSQRRPLGRRIRLPDRTATATELGLRRAETPARVTLVEHALASLVSTLRQLGGTPPDFLGVLVDDDSVEILLSHPAPPPAPWVASAEGFRWRVTPSMLPVERPLESAPLPALAALGRVAAGNADALLNLEAAGMVAVTGKPADAAGVVYALATHLIGAPWARAVNLILVGFPPGLASTDNVREVASLAELADELGATRDIMSATARQHGCPDLFTGRLRGQAGDGWPPVVVLSARLLRNDEYQLLSQVALPGQGVAAVVVAPAGTARWEVDVSSRPCSVSPLRLAVEPTVLDPSIVAAIAALIEVAGDDRGASLRDPPYDRIELSVDHPSSGDPGPIGDRPSSNDRPSSVDRPSSGDPQPLAAAGPGPGVAHSALTVRLAQLHSGNGIENGADGNVTNGDVPLPDFGQPPILVRVLGSVEVDGAAEFKRAKSRELAVYLAMHPNGVGEAELDEALWASSGARVVAPSTRDATVSVARTALGGAARLLPAQGQGREKRYQLGPEVQSDWAQFCALHRFGRDHGSAAALRQALELVRGRPFEAVVSGRTYGWIHTEGHGRHIEAEVADAADLAADLFLRSGDALAARRAARRGLLAEPYTERLWVRLMEAADMLGESQEIERIMDEMDVVLELEGDFTGLHPNTLAVYDRLSRRHRFPAGT